MIKCVIWDLDNTLLAGTYLESPAGPPPADPAMAAVLAVLAGRGILHAIASRNPPEAGQHAEQVTGHAFAAIQCGWGAKPAAITAIMTELGLAADEVAFVDDDALERGEAAFTLPEVLVLAPHDLAEAVSWPQFSPPAVTDEARRRGELYLARRSRREEATAFGGSREEFLRSCQTEVTIALAARADVPRLHELSVRTHQFSSRGEPVSEAALETMIGSPGRQVVTVRLRDRFADDGLVGGCLVVAGGHPAGWEVPALMMSCRAMGRGVIDALLAWICLAAREAGAASVTVPCAISPRNVPLRIALTGAGFLAGSPAAGAVRSALYVRDLDQPLPEVPDWVTDTTGGAGQPGPPGEASVTGELRQLLAELTGDSRPLRAPLRTPLLRDGIGLDSLGGTTLLIQVQRRFGVDVADEDLNLDSLATIGTLAAFIAARAS